MQLKAWKIVTSWLNASSERRLAFGGFFSWICKMVGFAVAENRKNCKGEVKNVLS